MRALFLVPLMAVSMSAFADTKPTFHKSGGTVPIQELELCAKMPNARCIRQNLTDVDLAWVSASINAAFKPVPLKDLPERSKHWRVFPEDGMAGCADYAVSKLYALLGLGFPADKLTLVIGQAQFDGKTFEHMTLEAEVAGQVWVLDNLSGGKIYLTTQRPYPWTETSRQPKSGVVWSVR